MIKVWHNNLCRSIQDIQDNICCNACIAAAPANITEPVATEPAAGGLNITQDNVTYIEFM